MTHVVIIGNATSDAELRTTPRGTEVASFRVAVNDRIKNDDGTWVDGEPTFYSVSAWDPIASGVSEQVRKGTRVIVTGKLKSRTYETKDGIKGQSLDVRADEVGVSTGLKKRSSNDTEEASWDTPF